jgi:hypothetical protein
LVESVGKDDPVELDFSLAVLELTL